MPPSVYRCAVARAGKPSLIAYGYFSYEHLRRRSQHVQERPKETQPQKTMPGSENCLIAFFDTYFMDSSLYSFAFKSTVCPLRGVHDEANLDRMRSPRGVYPEVVEGLAMTPMLKFVLSSPKIFLVTAPCALRICCEIDSVAESGRTNFKTRISAT